jgi:hypothetical protein
LKILKDLVTDPAVVNTVSNLIESELRMRLASPAVMKESFLQDEKMPAHNII